MKVPACLLTLLFTACQQPPAATVTPEDRPTEPVRTVDELRMWGIGSLDGDETIGYIDGWVFGYVPGERPQKLFGLEGYNIRRLIPVPEVEGDLYSASREVLFYTDPETGEVLDDWTNPYTGETVEVFDIKNDPVNYRFRERDGKYVTMPVDASREFGSGPPPQEWDDYFVFYADIFPFYPLPGQEKSYTAAELFDTYVPKSALYDHAPPPVMGSWTRVGPWLPWMKMDGHDGVLVYHARSRRLYDWQELPERIRTRVLAEYPEYRHAPETVDESVRNATSWTIYRQEMERRAATEKS